MNQKTGCLSIQKKRKKVASRKKKMHRHPVSPKGILLIVLLDLFKVSKMTNFNSDLFKVSKMTKFFCFFFWWYIFLYEYTRQWLTFFAWDFRVNAYVHIPMVLSFMVKLLKIFENGIFSSF